MQGLIPCFQGAFKGLALVNGRERNIGYTPCQDETGHPAARLLVHGEVGEEPRGGKWAPGGEPEALEQAASDPAQDEADSEHSHDQPMLGHSELVSHIRDYHEHVPFDGSTIQLRLLHERAHA